MNDKTHELIATRRNTHGDWKEQSALSQKMKDLVRKAPGWDQMTYAQREAVDMLIVKTSRIVCGNPDEPDHWDDIGGYARLGKQGHEGV